MMSTKRKVFMIFICPLLLAALRDTGQMPRQPADYVNPFIGASTSVDKAGAVHGLGKTFPGDRKSVV